MGAALQTLWHVISRKKPIEPNYNREQPNRWCGEWAASALGLGVFVLAGLVSQRVAGPAALLSFVAAAFAALFAGLCYAELRWRAPRAASAYSAAAVCVGELAAFLLGWMLVLEGVFGACVAAKGLSMSIDWLAGHRVVTWMQNHVHINSPYFGHYFDILAFALVIALGVLLLIGLRSSVPFNNLLALLNIVVVFFIIIAGALYADPSNWRLIETESPPENQTGGGGFFPWGAWGVLRGTALAFYGFVGYDTVTAPGTMAKELRRSIPFAILISLGVLLVCYGGVVIVLTMMLPYDQIPYATIAEVFRLAGAQWQPWVVGVAAVYGLYTSLFTVMCILPRVIKAMASDGLLPRPLASFWGKLVPTVIVAVLTSIFELKLLLLMMCITTLLSYAVVSLYVLLLRYQHGTVSSKESTSQSWFVCMGVQPTRATYTVTLICVGLFVATCISTALVGSLVSEALIPAVTLHAVAAIIFVVIAIQPRNNPDIAFKTPLVPLVPCLCIYVNVNLMVLVDLHSWIRVIICVIIGIPIYFVSVCIQKPKKKLSHLEGNVNEAFTTDFTDSNGKLPIQIRVESPTPPESINMTEIVRSDEEDNITTTNSGGNEDQHLEIQKFDASEPAIQKEIMVQHAAIEYNEEKEAKIIDLLDRVLQAEEDSFGEISSLHEENDETEIIISVSKEPLSHSKSFSELSDTASDASIGDIRHDVVAQVHREDMPTVDEDSSEEHQHKPSEDIEDDEKVTYFGIRETNSPTDESGYSDSTENIPDSNGSIEEQPRIPTPPPLEGLLLPTSPFKKSFTVPSRPRKTENEVEKPRESVTSKTSYDDSNIVFGSSRQLNFMSKLDNIYQNKIINLDNDEPRIRSKSAENVFDSAVNLNIERPALFLDLNKELLEREHAQTLKPVTVKEDTNSGQVEKKEEEDEELSMSRGDLKSKLEVLLSSGGPVLLRPRLMKSNPPTPEEVAPDQTSDSVFVKVMSKSDKNDTLKRQKAKFGAVLNSIRLSFNKDDVV